MEGKITATLIKRMRTPEKSWVSERKVKWGLVKNANTNAISIQLYPNPIVTDVHLEITTAKSERVNVIIVDIHGRVVKNISSLSLVSGISHIEINTEMIPSGMYIFRVEKEGFTYQSKFIKQ